MDAETCFFEAIEAPCGKNRLRQYSKPLHGFTRRLQCEFVFRNRAWYHISSMRGGAAAFFDSSTVVPEKLS